MKYLLLFLALNLIALNTYSQTTLSGTVRQQDGNSLSGVNIFILGTYDGGTSDTSGFFRFTTQKTGKCVLTATYLGYEPVVKELDLSGEPVILALEIKEKSTALTEVAITAGTVSVGDKKQANILTSRDMITTAGAVGDVYGALQTLPGTTTNGESGKLFVKGGDSDESKTFIDGSLVYAPYTTSAPNMSVRGRFNPVLFKGTIFSTGGYSAEYGQALSSVLLLNTNDLPAEEKIDLSLMSIGLGIGGTKLWKSGSITVDASYNNMEPYMRIVPQNYQWVRYPRYTECAFSIRQKTGKSGLLKLYGSYGNSKYTVGQEDPDEEMKTRTYALGNGNIFLNASWINQLGENWTLTSSASFTNNQDIIGYDSISFNKLLRGAHIKNVAVHRFSERIDLRLGAELFSKACSQEYIVSSDTVTQGFTNHSVSGFAEAEFRITAKFVTRLGTRLEYSDYLNRANLVPRVSAAYLVTQASQISLSYGWFCQDPSDDYLLYTNTLDYERADHYTLNYQIKQNRRTFRAEVYYKKYKGLAKLNGDDFYLPDSYSNTGFGYAKGLDLFWRDNKTIRNGDYWLSYSYIVTKRNYRNYPVEAIPGFVSRHNFAAVYKHWIGGLRSYLSVNFKYSSPRVYNNPNSEVFNGERTLPYRSVDVSWSFLYRQNVVIYAAVTNVFGFKQGYGYTYSASRDSEGQYRSIPIVPGADRFFLLACFVTLSRKGEANQIDQIQ